MKVKKLTFALLLACCLLVSLAAIPAFALPSAVSGYTLVFDEPFTASAITDTQFGYQWTGYEGGGATDAVALADGYLYLTSYSYMDGGTLKHIGGCVATHSYNGDDYDWTYGYIEARIDFNNTTGNNMAYWMEADNMFADPALAATYGNEVDIIEHRASDGDGNSKINWDHMAIHWYGYGDDSDYVTYGTTISGISNGFHNYGLLWTSSSYKFYVDDVLKKTWNASFWDWGDWEYKYVMSNSPEWIILSCTPTGGWCGSYPAGGYGDVSTSTTKMIVDYVRVYQNL